MHVQPVSLFALGFLLACLLVVAGCQPKVDATPAGAPPRGPSPVEKAAPNLSQTTIRFTDVTAEAGVKFTYQNGREAGNFAILESLGGGVGMLDYDHDGRLDLFFPGGGGYRGKELFGLPAVLYRNLGDWRFANISAAAGGGFPAAHYSHGCMAADYDNDGFDDVLVTGYGGLQLWRNQGDGTLVEVHSAAGLHDSRWSSAAGWGDVNNDGALDLYVGHYVNWSFENNPACTGLRYDQRDICPPKVFDGLPDMLYLGNGDGTFRDVTQEAGLGLSGKCLGVVLGDLDLDGDLDIYVANDTTPNFFYLNDGHGAFREEAALRGVAVDDRGTPNGSMGVDVGDYNLDGLPDLWVANYEVESFALYRNEGHAQFLHVSRATGVTALNGLFVGFGTAFADFDRDGDEDIVVANGHVILHPRAAPLLQVPLLLINHQGKQFRRMMWEEEEYFGAPHAGRGLAVGDLDGDGDLDLAFSNNQEPAAVLRNDSQDKGESVRLHAIGRRSNRNAIGAVMVLETSAGRQMRMIRGGGSYISQNELSQTWGVAQGTRAKSLSIRWPGGDVQEIDPIPSKGNPVIVEP